MVSWCIGHLVELAPPETYDAGYAKWKKEDLPIVPHPWMYLVSEETKTQYAVLKLLLHDPKVQTVICATDAGREGELIFRLVYNLAGCKKPVKRLWISSLEESAIRQGFASLRDGREYDHLYQAALCRAQADWLVGIGGLWSDAERIDHQRMGMADDGLGLRGNMRGGVCSLCHSLFA